ncbi:MAG: hypothetical protein HKN76_13725 [Saprospiraceae bacterium]|nr:hypothetical protein [Saprospiraceae bacterium]
MVNQGSKFIVLGILTILPLFVFPAGNVQIPKDSFWISVKDTQRILLNLNYDPIGLPETYSSDIFTQVCETGECKPVRIKLFWDLMGQYLHYEMPDGAILTKLDHVPFNENDYIKFGIILSSSQSMLEDFDITLLPGSREKASLAQIDGITGATPKSISSDIVDGAVYTCHTIWHLAHGAVQDSIALLTLDIADKDLMMHLLNHPNDDYQRWCIDHVFLEYPKEREFLNLIFSKINNENIFIAKHILRQLPEAILAQDWVQQVVWMKYGELPYSLQILTLRRFQAILLSSSLESKISGYKNSANFEQSKLLDQIRFKK